MVKSTLQGSKGGRGKGNRKEVRWRRNIEQAQEDFKRGSACKHLGSKSEKGNTGKGSRKEKVERGIRWRRDSEHANSRGF